MMLKAELEGRDYSKTEHRRKLADQIDRTRGAIEYKHQNISAVLQSIGEVWIDGYKPQKHNQKSLLDAVERWVDSNPGWIARPFKPPAAMPEQEELMIDQPPELDHEPQLEMREQHERMAGKFYVPEQDERNRDLGRAGEERVLAHERAVLARAGKHDLIPEVRWVSQKEGDGFGYDIASVTPDGRKRLIEVKTTTGSARRPFYITPNELEVSRANPDEWCLFRLWDFERDPKAFELYPPLEDHVLLSTANYRASFQ